MGKNDICKMTILYIDEDLEAGKTVYGRLVKNYPTQRIVHAESVFDASFLIQKYDPDVYVLALSMPSLEGLLFAQEVLNKGEVHPVIFLSTGSDKEKVPLCFTFGRVHCMAKPGDFDSLFYELDTLMVEVFLKRFYTSKESNEYVSKS